MVRSGMSGHGWVSSGLLGCDMARKYWGMVSLGRFGMVP